MAIEDVKELASRIPDLRPTIDDEAKTKQFLIQPVIKALDYNIDDPDEVMPEYTADYGGREGWRADYALMADGNLRVVIECKPLSNRLGSTETAQLGRYFTNARRAGAQIAMLTNGVVYKLFTDQNETNIMDADPFWEINLENLNDNDLIQLKNISKENFNSAGAVQTASRLKYIDAMKQILNRQYNQPDDAFAEWLARPLLPARARMTDTIKEMAMIAFHEFVKDTVSDALKSLQSPALKRDEDDSPGDDTTAETSEVKSEPSDGEQHNAETTAEEWSAFTIVKFLAGDVIDPARIILRDAKTYCAVHVDSSKKPLCRFYFNGAQKRLGLFDGTRASSGALIVTQHDIASVDGIHAYADQIRETARRHLES